MSVAIITGASRGLGRALAVELVARGWAVVVDARDAGALRAAEADIGASVEEGDGGMATTAPGAGRPPAGARVVALPGDVSDAGHRADLVAAAARLGGVDLLVNNASVLGPSPQPSLGAYPPDELRHVYDVNVVAPLALAALALPHLRRAPSPRVINLTSDASVEPYPGWGGYGSSKAALDHASAILAAEEPGIAVFALDPGDMRTQMHQEAFPGEDISDRPLPEAVVPAVVALVEGDRPSGRYRASDLLAAGGGPGGGGPGA
ncbi:MAG: SDR family NAD(P)-dependent oxidoreductase [Acidimicrobiales bacterium]